MIRSRRLNDAAACLEITGEILLRMYAARNGLVPTQDIGNQLDIWQKAILDVVMDSDDCSRHMEPADMFCYGLVKSILSGKLKITNGKNRRAVCLREYAGLLTANVSNYA